MATAIFLSGQAENEGLVFSTEEKFYIAHYYVRIMSAEIADNFTVKFGRIARTLNYEDAQGHITFTFDGHPKRKKCLYLETGGTKQRALLGTRFDVAVERSKKFLESCGFKVEIYDPAKGTPIDWNAFFLEQERAGFDVERKSADSVVVTKKANRGFLSRISSFFRK